MSEEERLELENELLLTKSKAQMINKYIDELKEIEKLNNIIKEAREYIKNYEDYDVISEEIGTYTNDLLNILDKENK